MHELLECRLAGIEVLELPSFLERETGKVRLDVLNPSWIIFGDGFRASPAQQFLERVFDLVASLGLLLLALPLMLLAMIGIKLEEGLDAPLFYRQKRVGYHRQVFDVLKFRSMRVDAEKFGAQYATENDPRVTRIGGFMRKTRIDELPQLLNVLRGEMSFVGPRPERPEFVERARAEDSVLPRTPHGQARHHRLGAALLPVRFVREGHDREAAVRPVLREESQPAVRPGDPGADGRSRALGQGRAVTITLGLLSYGLAAVGFLILTLLLAISWEGRAQGVRLIVACAVDGGVGRRCWRWDPDYAVLSAQLVLLAEFLRYGAWFIVLTGLTRGAGIAPAARAVAHVVWVGSVVLAGRGTRPGKAGTRPARTRWLARARRPAAVAAGRWCCSSRSIATRAKAAASRSSSS